MSESLVAYFSATNTTKRIAQRLAGLMHADIYEICPQVPYCREDLNWMDKTSRSTLEMKDPSSRPKIIDQKINLNKYSTIYLGFPIWWYTAPAIIRTFLESYDFNGKTIIVFATSGGSGLGNTVNELSNLAKGASFIEGGILQENAGDEQLKHWIEEIDRRR